MNTVQLFRGRVRQIHFVGIGGIGMSGIAEVLLGMGFDVRGSDIRESETLERLRSRGATVHIGHAASNVHGADVVVMSSAVQNANPEIVEARASGVPVIPRAEMLAELMRLKHGIAIAGSHGKTTTTSLVAAVLNHANVDPTVVIGGKVNQLGSNAKLGQGEYLVAEADESDGSFLKLNPTLAVVTNLDLEHVDFWQGGLPQLHQAFVDFLNRLPFYGFGVVCIDDANAQSLLPEVTRRIVTYGRSRQADYQAREIENNGMSTRMVIWRHGSLLGEIRLQLVGAHNALNALAAVAVADELGISFDKIQEALAKFEGVQRRFTHRGRALGIDVVDDYGHHPTEIRATLSSARNAYRGRRILALFQPHRYSRTDALRDDFARAFNDADIVLVTSVYAAGETPITGASGEDLVELMRRHGHHDARFVDSLQRGVEEILSTCKSGDVVLTLGAGDITKAGPMLLNAVQAAAAKTSVSKESV